MILNDIGIRWEEVKEEYFKYGIHINEFNGLRLSNIHTEPSPSNKALLPVFVEHGNGMKTDLNDAYILKEDVSE